MFGGSNMGNGGRVRAESARSHGRPASMRLVIPPLGVSMLKPARPLPPLPETAETTAKADLNSGRSVQTAPEIPARD